MNWHFWRRKSKFELSLGVIEELVRREVNRRLEQELSPHSVWESSTEGVVDFTRITASYASTRPSKLVSALETLGVPIPKRKC